MRALWLMFPRIFYEFNGQLFIPYESAVHVEKGEMERRALVGISLSQGGLYHV